MSRQSLKLIAVVLLSIVTTTTAFAADDGNTQPKLTSGGVGGGTSSPQNIIGTTNGAGNVKGVQCSSPSSTNLGGASISIYVNGGSAQTLALGAGEARCRTGAFRIQASASPSDMAFKFVGIGV